MKPVRPLAFALVPLLAVAASAFSDEHRTTRSCGQVAFTPSSDDVAGPIRATGLTCGLARDFVKDSLGRPGERFRGFRCTSAIVDEAGGLAYRRYRCTGAGDVIRWRRY